MKNKGLWKQSPKTIDITVLKAPVQSKIENQKTKHKKAKNMQKIKKFEIKNIFGIDCEMVGVGEGSAMKDVLARVSIVTKDEILLDEFVSVDEEVTEFRTDVSGMTPKKLAEAEYDFQTVSLLVQDILDHADVIVGHGIEIQTFSQRRLDSKLENFDMEISRAEGPGERTRLCERR